MQEQDFTLNEEAVVTIRCLGAIPDDVEALLAEIAAEEDNIK